ncbi:hypothetical protein BGW80DRAFT_1455203 [Lactifluus volemus]|nr:hypothetical protein BGW80DRAFT_1455203 [Lactifluus volemus]
MAPICLCTLYRARSGLETDLIPPPHNGGIGPRFVNQYTKQYLWSLDTIFGVRRVVYLEADMLVRHNFDKLFDLPFPFAAVPDVYVNSGFKLHFNAGMLSLHPNTSTFESVRTRISDARFSEKRPNKHS